MARSIAAWPAGTPRAAPPEGPSHLDAPLTTRLTVFLNSPQRLPRRTPWRRQRDHPGSHGVFLRSSLLWRLRWFVAGSSRWLRAAFPSWSGFPPPLRRRSRESIFSATACRGFGSLSLRRRRRCSCCARMGNWAFAIGQNLTAAEKLGAPVARATATLFALSGLSWPFIQLGICSLAGHETPYAQVT